MQSPFAPIAPRELAKSAAFFLISAKSTDIVSDVMADHTSLDEDSRTVRYSSGLIGMYVAMKLNPLSDKIIDKTADFLLAANARRKDNKKNDTEEK